MALLEAEQTTDVVAGGDAAAIAELQRVFAAQRKAFAADRQPTLEVRRERLEQVKQMMLDYRAQVADALVKDFGAHPGPASDALEVDPVALRVQYALDHLEEWMRPIARDVDAAYASVLRAFIKSQPKGVVGNIVPWNFPFEIGFGPLVDMLAAGDRVLIKPSEFAPASAKLMQEMAAATFPEDLVYVAVGGLELSKAFAELPLDHLLYTGSSNVGKQVMAAAAKNLTPVTLELGGKCPVVLLPGSVTPDAVGGVLGVKMIKNGQMCVSVDHCFVPRADMETFVATAKGVMAAMAPDYAKSAACTGIISDRHMDRMTGMLDEAKGSGATVVTLEENGTVDKASRRMPMSLVVDPAKDLKMMTEEIFGPILPVIPYDEVDEVIEQINAGERPLGVYIFGTDVALIDRVMGETLSGGGAVNAAAIQAGLKSLPFGGVGNSGMGRHHGEEGFREFSNQRGIVVRGEGEHFDHYVAHGQSLKDLVGSMPTG